MKVKIVDVYSINEPDCGIVETSEEMIFSGVADVVVRRKMFDKSNPIKRDDVSNSIGKSAAMILLTSGETGFMVRLKEPIGEKKATVGQGRYIDWMEFVVTCRDKKGQLIMTHNFVTDKDVYLMNDQGQTVERYSVTHR